MPQPLVFTLLFGSKLKTFANTLLVLTNIVVLPEGVKEVAGPDNVTQFFLIRPSLN